MIFEIENEGLKTYFNRALWLPLNFVFIGENQRGDHVRVAALSPGRGCRRLPRAALASAVLATHPGSELLVAAVQPRRQLLEAGPARPDQDAEARADGIGRV